MIRRVAVATVGCLAAAAFAADLSYEDARKMLPDYSEGTVGLLGPFVWSRAMDLGEDVHFADATGRADRQGAYLWMYQFCRNKRQKGITELFHGRSSLVSALPEVAYTVQPTYFLHNTTGPHNSKIVFGYVQSSPEKPAFQHGDNADLAHLTAADRVVVFFPVRKDANADGQDPKSYYVNPHYSAQTPCVIEFKKHEMIHYEWFANPKALDAHILFDLRPYFSGDKALNPATSKPILRFDIDGKGGWKLRIKRQGAGGVKDVNDDAAYDHVFTNDSPGAKKYTVDVTRQNSAWAMSVFSPGGSPTDTSEVLLKLQPYDRDSGDATAWPDRSARVRDLKVEKLPDMLNQLRKGPPASVKGNSQ